MRKYAFVAAGLLLSLVLGATVFREPIAWAAQSVDATIIGPLDSNGNVKVHEQGTANVNVTNTLLPVHEQGTAAVREQGTVTVRVADAPGEQPFAGGHSEAVVTIADGSFFGSDAFTVPSGKRLVIQSVSGFTALPLGQVPQLIALRTSSGGVAGRHDLNAEKRATYSGLDWWVFSQQVSMYADGGSIVSFVVNRFPDNSGPGEFTWWVTGYLINE